MPPFSIVNQTAREEVLSSDFVATQNLASAQLQDVLRNSCTGPLSTAADPTAQLPVAISSLNAAPTFVPSVVNMTAQITAGQAFIAENTVYGTANFADATVSDYQVARWQNTTITINPGDAANPRLDVVYLYTAGQAGEDVHARNFLLDPVARTVAAANTPKRVVPRTSVLYIAGTAAANPVPPALPVGSAAPLFYIFVPALTATADSCSASRQLHQRVEFPLSTYHGVVRGCELDTVVATDDSQSSHLIFAYGGSDGARAQTRYNQAVINGELITWVPSIFASSSATSNYDGFNLFQRDNGAGNPWAAAAPATHDVPYYIYLCGGRNFPCTGGDGGVTPGIMAPVIVVESLTPPTTDGFASAPLVNPRGNIPVTATLYIGVGWKISNSTRRKCVRYDGQWAYAAASYDTHIFLSFREPGFTVAAGIAVEQYSLTTRPVTSRMCEIAGHYGTGPAAEYLLLRSSPNPTVGAYALPLFSDPTVGASSYAPRKLVFSQGSFGNELGRSGNQTQGGVLNLYPIGYHINVPRLT